MVEEFPGEIALAWAPVGKVRIGGNDDDAFVVVGGKGGRHEAEVVHAVECHRSARPHRTGI